MIDTTIIQEDLKGLLDNDLALNTLLGTIENNSKVLIRNTLPNSAQVPLILISDVRVVPHRQGQKDNQYEGTISVNVSWPDSGPDGPPIYFNLNHAICLIDGLIRGGPTQLVSTFAGEYDEFYYRRVYLVSVEPGVSEAGITSKVITYTMLLGEKNAA